MRPNKAKTAVHGCHCSGDMAACIRYWPYHGVSCAPLHFKVGFWYICIRGAIFYGRFMKGVPFSVEVYERGTFSVKNGI